jgi:acetyltransferase-like isoleucine patch superfamily enzyme
MARNDAKGELKLVAYYISNDNTDLTVTELRRQLETKLPDYMIPHLFIRMTEFPMTPSGKMDKNSLPAPDASRPALKNALVEGQTETEKTLTAIWKEVLGQKQLGVIDNFFDLGGDSLQAAQILHLVHLRCGVDLHYSSLLQAPRITDLAKIIDQPKSVSSSDAPATAVGQPHHKEGLIRGALNRILQVLALYAPGLVTLRPALHRMRGVRIGRNVAIGASAIIETKHPELVWIGDNVAIGIRNVIIAHFSDSMDRSQETNEPTVRICDNVYIGASVTILPNVTIGEGAVISAGSVVFKSVAPKTMVKGNPAIPVAICGLPLVGDISYSEFLKHLKPLNGGDATEIG